MLCNLSKHNTTYTIQIQTLNGTEIDVLGITSRHRGVVIAWHKIDRAR